MTGSFTLPPGFALGLAADAQARFDISDESGVGWVRRGARVAATNIGLSDEDAGRVAVVATEIAGNTVRHGGGGTVLIRALPEGGVELLAYDCGRGIPDIEAAQRDGHSTAGTPGTGLGAIRRMSDQFEIASTPGRGTIVLARLWARPAGRHRDLPGSAQLGVVCQPVAGETACGDSWAVRELPDRLLVVVADGLGHGPGAASASRAAVEACITRPEAGLAERLALAHELIAGSRGSGVAIASIDRERRCLNYAAVGNIGGVLVGAACDQGLPSHNGTVGVAMRRVQEFIFTYAPGALLVMHTDGITGRWRHDHSPTHPALLAAEIFRDHQRGRDDATVACVRLP